MKREPKVFFYEDELNDDFAGVSRNEKIIGDDYRYINRNPFFRALSFLIYRIVMTPIAYFYCRCSLGLKIENRIVMKEFKGKSFFLYANHTQMPGDGYLPTLVSFPTKPYVLVHPDSVALKGTEQFMLMIGAMPLPSTLRGLKNLQKAIAVRIKDGNCIMIYPEAHIWPYYTGIRPFQSVSFKYPIKLEQPSFCFTSTYQQHGKCKKPRLVAYVDGPFYPNPDLPTRKQQDDLRDRIYETMKKRAANSNMEYIRYEKRPKNEEQRTDTEE